MILAVALAFASGLGAAWALIAHRKREVPIPAIQTPERREPDYVTREHLKAAVEDAVEQATKDITFEWNEMYEKFEKLHLRLAKRDKRKQDAQAVEHDEQLAAPLGRSVLPYRRLGSV